jgi:hypothetical protein
MLAELDEPAAPDDGDLAALELELPLELELALLQAVSMRHTPTVPASMLPTSRLLRLVLRMVRDDTSTPLALSS